MSKQYKRFSIAFTVLLSAFIPGPASAAFTVQLAPVSSSALPVGSRIQFQANPLPSGTLNYRVQMPHIWCRSVRMRDLYTYLD
jgi:hypothetical protein